MTALSTQKLKSSQTLELGQVHSSDAGPESSSSALANVRKGIVPEFVKFGIMCNFPMWLSPAVKTELEGRNTLISNRILFMVVPLRHGDLLISLPTERGGAFKGENGSRCGMS